jgi:hypothetical protein
MGSRGWRDELHVLWLDGGDRAAGSHGSRLPALPLPGLRAVVQRAQRFTVRTTDHAIGPFYGVPPYRAGSRGGCPHGAPPGCAPHRRCLSRAGECRPRGHQWRGGRGSRPVRAAAGRFGTEGDGRWSHPKVWAIAAWRAFLSRGLRRAQDDEGLFERCEHGLDGGGLEQAGGLPVLKPNFAKCRAGGIWLVIAMSTTSGLMRL